jgi:sugar O-acyltransferase (sialic acid O-acetyltransferase NeuD family)
MKKLVIIGCGGVSEVIADMFMRGSDFKLVAFSVEQKYVPETKTFLDFPVFAYENIMAFAPPHEYAFFVAIGGNQLNQLRYRFFSEMISKGYFPASYISPKASVSPKANVGMHCCILENVVIHACCHIGDNVMIFPNTYMGHHTVIGDHCFIAACVTIAGHVWIGEKSFLGAGTAVANGVRLGDGNFLEMGARCTRSTERDMALKSAPSETVSGAKDRFSNWHQGAAAVARKYRGKA